MLLFRFFEKYFEKVLQKNREIKSRKMKNNKNESLGKFSFFLFHFLWRKIMENEIGNEDFYKSNKRLELDFVHIKIIWGWL